MYKYEENARVRGYARAGGGMIELESVDVIMCTWNSNRPFFEKCLESIKREIPVHHFIVVDRFSHDGTIDAIKRHFEPIVVKTNTNLAEARALGIAQVDTEYFVFVDDDIELPTDWFKRVTSFINEKVGAIHEEVVWAGKECMDDSLINRLVSERWIGGSLSFSHHKMIIIDAEQDTMSKAVGLTWGGHTIMKSDIVKDWKPGSLISAAEDLLLLKQVVNKGYIWRILDHHTVRHYGHRNIFEHFRKQKWHIAGLRATGFSSTLKELLKEIITQSLKAARQSVNSKEPMIFAYTFITGLIRLDGYLRWNKFYVMER